MLAHVAHISVVLSIVDTSRYLEIVWLVIIKKPKVKFWSMTCAYICFVSCREKEAHTGSVRTKFLVELREIRKSYNVPNRVFRKNKEFRPEHSMQMWHYYCFTPSSQNALLKVIKPLALNCIPRIKVKQIMDNMPLSKRHPHIISRKINTTHIQGITFCFT